MMMLRSCEHQKFVDHLTLVVVTSYPDKFALDAHTMVSGGHSYFKLRRLERADSCEPEIYTF